MAEQRIINSKGNIDGKTAFNMMKSAEIRRMSDYSGETIQIDRWIVYEDVKQNGDTVTVLSIMSVNGDCYATNSSTFIEDFNALNGVMEQYGGSLESIKIVSGTSKAGRTFITCAPQ